MPGEAPEPRELGIEVPRDGLYIREDGDMKCNRMLSSFVRKNLDNAHKVLVERILKKAERVEETIKTMGQTPITPGPGTPRFQPGSHMSNSQILNTPAVYNRPLSPQMLSPQQDMPWQQQMSMHPAYRSDDKRMSTYSLPPYQAHAQQQRMSYYAPPKQPEPSKQFLAELPGSTFHTGNLSPPQRDAPSLDHRMSMVSELSGSDSGTYVNSADPRGQSSENGSMVSENFNVRRLSAQGVSYDRPQSVVSAASGHSDNPDRMSMISELPSSQHR